MIDNYFRNLRTSVDEITKDIKFSRKKLGGDTNMFRYRDSERYIKNRNNYAYFECRPSDKVPYYTSFDSESTS